MLGKSKVQMLKACFENVSTVKPVLSGHLEIEKQRS